MKKADYGIDAPGEIRNFVILGVAFLFLAIFFPVIKPGVVIVTGMFWPAGWCLGIAGLMLLYSKVGKFNHAKRMVQLAQIGGHEEVLDVGTGRGLVMIEAAKSLTTGHATGLDIWNAVDLSGNAEKNAKDNISLEGVDGRCSLVDASAQSMPFENGRFDVVLSNMCLHNITPRSEQDKACAEIVRVLRPGGIAVISDFRDFGHYTQVFEKAGLTCTRQLFPFDTFPPVTVLTGNKPS
jgi:arsenite methyltransferase